MLPVRCGPLRGAKGAGSACGGGLVPGSALLIGGDPGVGKSTLLLQVAAGLAKGGALDQIQKSFVQKGGIQ